MNLMDPGCFIKLLNNPVHFSAVSFEEWRISGSNRPPQTCHACALPDELIPPKRAANIYNPNNPEQAIVKYPGTQIWLWEFSAK